MATMISHSHSPLNLSPSGSPSLRPTHHQNISNMPALGSASLPNIHTVNGTTSQAQPISPRSYARQPTQRPYASPLASRSSPRNAAREVSGDTLKFAEMVVGLVRSRQNEARKGGLGLEVEHTEDIAATDGEAPAKRKTKSLAGSLAGSYECERAELIVDIPVWSPGCFQDLSTLHALRDTTLSHTHSLLAHLIGQHSIPASYRLLARSAVTSNRHQQRGWGCIRLAPAGATHATGTTRADLKPKIRRSSVDLSEGERHNARDEARHRSAVTKALFLTSSLTTIRNTPSPGDSGESSPVPSALPVFGAAFRSGRSVSPALSGTKTPEMRLEEAIADDEEEALMDAEEVRLKEGYRSGSASDDEDEEDADTLVAKEVQRRKAKEGTAFLMTLFGGPALILV